MHLILVQCACTEVGRAGWQVKTQAWLELIGGQDQRQSLVQGVLSIRGIRGLLAVDKIILGECVDQERLGQSQDLGKYSHFQTGSDRKLGKTAGKMGAEIA